MNFEDLKNTVSNITLYDVKSAIRKAQNVVLNYSEMESKVREATNNEPWGASSTLMQEIANGTYSYQQFNEIMQMLYKRFTDKSAEEWRQIYKALVLLEFLVKNGSERVVDDARTHVATIKILRNFHFIDEKGKDQGVNVRNRAKELADLLSDSEKIRAERRKAKSTKSKYTGVGSDEAGFGGSGKKYGGFGSEDLSYGSYSGQVYGDGGGFSTGGGYSGGSDFQDRPSRGAQFEEYDEFDDGGARAPPPPQRSSVPRRSTPKKDVPTSGKKEPDLFSFDDDVPAATSTSNGKGKQVDLGGDDDFDDFQSASTTTTAAPTNLIPAMFSAPPIQQSRPSAPTSTTSFSSTFTNLSISTPPIAQPTRSPIPPSSFSGFPTTSSTKPLSSPMASQPNYFSQPAAPTTVPPLGNRTILTVGQTAAPAKPSGDAFGSLWSSALGKDTTKKDSGTKVSMAQLAQEKSTNALWGGATPTQQQQQGRQGQGQSGSSGLDDLLF